MINSEIVLLLFLKALFCLWKKSTIRIYIQNNDNKGFGFERKLYGKYKWKPSLTSIYELKNELTKHKFLCNALKEYL